MSCSVPTSLDLSRTSQDPKSQPSRRLQWFNNLNNQSAAWNNQNFNMRRIRQPMAPRTSHPDRLSLPRISSLLASAAHRNSRRTGSRCTSIVTIFPTLRHRRASRPYQAEDAQQTFTNYEKCQTQSSLPGLRLENQRIGKRALAIHGSVPPVHLACGSRINSLCQVILHYPAAPPSPSGVILR